MFRHEKTFYHRPGIGIELKTSEEETGLRRKITDFESYSVERVGEVLHADLFLITHDSPDPEDLVRTVGLVRHTSKKSLVLDCPDSADLRRGLDLLKGERPAVLLRRPVDDALIEMARSHPAVLILTSQSLEDLAGQASKAKDAGVEDLMLNMAPAGLGVRIQDYVIARRSALKNNFKPFGFPIFGRIKGTGDLDTMASAAALLCKYASIIVLPDFDKAMLYTLLTLRQNIYTDPQKPIQVDPKIYAVGEPTPESPVFVTTNFSLTYFIVSGEIENSGISAHLVVCDCEGQSVMTAWAAGKFVGETVAKFFKAVALEDQVTTRKVVIPGYAAVIQGDLEEKMPGWKVIVGPQEASDIPAFVKNVSIT